LLRKHREAFAGPEGRLGKRLDSKYDTTIDADIEAILSAERKAQVLYRSARSEFKNPVADRYALPKQDSIFHALARAIYFSIIDANKGYRQFGLSSRSRRFTAFVTEDGFWEFRRMPFGLTNAPALFQRAMDAILGSYRYVSDHRMHVSLVLEALEKVGMTVVEQKCHFATFTI